MAYIPPAGKAAKGEGAEDLPRIKVIYVGKGFDCVSLVGPGQNLLSAVELAKDHGITQACKQLGLARRNLCACASASLYNQDGSLVPAKEWAKTNCIYVWVQPGKEQEGLLRKCRKQHEYMEKLVRQQAVLRDVTAYSDGRENSDSSTHADTLMSEISDLKGQVQILSKKVEEQNILISSLRAKVEE